MDYNLGTNRGCSNGLKPQDIDPRFIAAVLQSVEQMREELSEMAAPAIEAVRKLQAVRDSFQQVADQLAPTFAALHRRVPHNWPPSPDGLELDGFYRVLAEGIPLAFVPGRDSVAALVEAPDYASRVDVLIDRAEHVIDECRATLAEHPLHSSTQGMRPLLDEALTVLSAGHFASAQALAVCISDTLLHETWQMRSYQRIVKGIESTDEDEAFYRGFYRYWLALRPAIPFLDNWDSLSGAPLPTRLSRHATVHGASVEHLTEANAIIAVMLATSLLLGVSEWNGIGD